VLVLHAWWGLSDGIRRYCDRLAESDRPEAYDAAAASLAFRRTVGFLQSQHPGR
jgi:dienelactone hydrolase